MASRTMNLTAFLNVLVVILFIFVYAALCEVHVCTVSRTSSACRGMAGHFLPQEHSPDLRFLYIVDSDLSALTAEDFAPLPNLMTLHIDNCSFPAPSQRSLFTELKNLEILEITRSNLSEKFENLFVNNTELLKLYLEGNHIRNVSKDSFKHLRSVQTIDMSLNQISELDAGAFADLPSLKEVKLTHNRLGESFDPAYLFTSPSECASCVEGSVKAECGGDALALWRGNRAVDSLWRGYRSAAALFLEGNPACERLAADAEGGGGCEGHQQRRAFYSEACGGAGRRGAVPEPSEDPAPVAAAAGGEALPLEWKQATPPPEPSPEEPPLLGLKAASVSAVGMFAATTVLIVAALVVLWRRRARNIARTQEAVEKEEEPAVEMKLLRMGSVPPV